MLTLMNLTGIANPPYLFRPMQVAHRVWRELAWRLSSRETVRLPWKLGIAVNPHEAIGYNISTRGVYDLAVTETLWRLADPGELAVDAGANIGYTASLLAVRVGTDGQVLCFEPHPEVFAWLRENVSVWQRDQRCGTLVLHEAALGSAGGVSTLKTGDLFDSNRGTATIMEAEGSKGAGLRVRMECLDDVLTGDRKIGVMKIDVEGAELEALQGMRRILGRRGVRDIVFEEVRAYPAATHDLLKSFGYTVLGLEAGMLGVRCVPGAAPKVASRGDPPNYLATIEPDRAARRLGRAGWRSFGILSGLPCRS
jgi:FkbM family methyltransferase